MDKGLIIWLGKTWQFESNARAWEAVRQMAREGIAPLEHPEWAHLYPSCLKADRRYNQCLWPRLGACFYPGKERITVCCVEHQLTLELRHYARLPMPFLAEIRPLQKPHALKRLGRARTLKLPGGRRRKAKVHKFKSRPPAHVKTYRMPLCCMEQARIAPRRLLDRGATAIRLTPTTEDAKDYAGYLEATLPCLKG